MKLVATAKFLDSRIRKINLRLIIYSHSSTNHANFGKIGPIDFEIHVTGLREIVIIRNIK